MIRYFIIHIFPVIFIVIAGWVGWMSFGILNNEYHITGKTKESNSINSEKFLIDRIMGSSVKIRKSWTVYDIQETAIELEKASISIGEPVEKLLALIAVESGFNPKVVRNNRGGSRDFGLTQQNSRYVQKRCQKEFKRYCYWQELLDPVVSVRLMKRTLISCQRFGRELMFLCYNSPKEALKKNIKHHYYKKWKKILKGYVDGKQKYNY